MYTVLFLLFMGLAITLVVLGLKKNKYWQVWLGIMVGLVTFLSPHFINFWGEMLWFDAVGYGKRFWTLTLTQTGMLVIPFLGGALLVYLLTFSIASKGKYLRNLASLVGGFLSALWGSANWEAFLKFWYGVSTSVTDPIIGKDTGFYLFTYPLLRNLYALLVLLTLVALITSLSAIFLRKVNNTFQVESLENVRLQNNRVFSSFYICAALFLFVLAYSKFLDRYELMYSNWGAATGPGWTDVHIRLPAYNFIWIFTAIMGLLILIPAGRRMIYHYMMKVYYFSAGAFLVPFVTLGFTLAVWFIALSAIPGLFQWLRVEPNEITFEKPYIAHNIEFTRQAFRLDKVEEREFPASEILEPAIISRNQNLFDNVRLWDWRALDAVYKQFQEIRLYYEFNDLDLDRYMIDGKYQEVMVSAREMEVSNLPTQSQTFVNKRFKYTHGYGITLTTVHDFTDQGLPRLLIKDIPPKAEYPELKVERPEIYYGELTDSHVIVNSKEEEFDYPNGEDNTYVRYAGKGGVQISNLWRKFVFGYMFDGTKLLVSDYPTEESRIMFHRQIQKRVELLAPFLHFENDPYIVLDQGRLKWMIDAYTTSDNYPYSEPFYARENIEYTEGEYRQNLTTNAGRELSGINYIRNSVKAVVDAYDGTVDFYIADEEDPIIQVWDKIFPGLFKPKSEMPESLVKHIRYPEKMILIQGLVYAKYHMTDPEVFYNQEDLWIRATEKYYNQVQPVEPYYIMWQLPESDKPEFVLIQPFTPKNRQVLAGWIAGLSDGDNYGRFLAYKFPKEKRILGPQQVETKIDQDSFLSGQLTLWDQRGSKVIRGNVLAIPVEETIIYVEPIYLQSETAAYPELRLVVVMHGDNLSYAPNFDDALAGLFDKSALLAVTNTTNEGEEQKSETAKSSDSFNQLAQQANQAFEKYLELNGQKKFQEAARELNNLSQSLKQMVQQEPLADSVTTE